MRISSYSMELNSSSAYQTVESEELNLKSWVDSPKESNKHTLVGAIVLDLSEEGKKLSLQAINSNDFDKISPSSESSDDIPDEADHKQRLISDFIYILTGKRLKFVNIKLKDFKPLSSNNTNITNAPLNSTSADGTIQTPTRAGWGVNFNYNSSYSEKSQVSFSAKGIVRTSDGREIDLEFNLNMSRTFFSQTSISFKAGDALLDPLVINLGNTPASLSSKKLSFDINIDGAMENISLPSSNSGFLVIDKNKNGRIDDGSELFGPQSGNGFEELSKYDSDDNGWIDESDSIYNNLQIWQHDDSGASSLIALGKAGVGAIYLQSTETEFKLADDQNNTQGVLRQTSIYLRENGTAGTVQHIDLVI